LSAKADTGKSPLFSIPKASASELRGRQSIRATFKLSSRCVDAIQILGSHLRLKPKSLFDHLVQENATLETIATEIKKLPADNAPKITKTYVISRDAAETLNTVAAKRKISRDDLVEISIGHLIPLIQKEQIRHDSRKMLLKKMQDGLHREKKLLQDMVSGLGESDPMCSRMQNAVSSYEKMVLEMAEFIEKGKNIEKFTVA
jgi:hypothetical protein